MSTPAPAGPRLRVLVVDDEQPVLDELVWLLSRDPSVDVVRSTTSGTKALRILEEAEIDLVFLDIAMPGLSGVEIARLVRRFERRPLVVFVTAHDEHAVEAFEMNAVDYLLKPLREERVREAVRRALAQPEAPAPNPDERIRIELAGVTRFVQRSTVTDVEAQGDYVRLHTLDGGAHLVRTTLSQVADEWAEHGFVRVHRSHVVALHHVREVRQRGGRTTLVLPDGDGVLEVDVARRLHRDLRELIHDRA
ncbi:LytTR family DNA-binding domain-containing protein [Aeromicrobium halocynthiae]|uniref:LytTR family DNA-binding domain-containing protein n=1 Tax=Aeromicrobium halocynthiae TaxID=560557 RepID=A0ABN2W2T3_9ACTN